MPRFCVKQKKAATPEESVTSLAIYIYIYASRWKRAVPGWFPRIPALLADGHPRFHRFIRVRACVPVKLANAATVKAECDRRRATFVQLLL